jgi:hypothetical protein
MGAIPMDDDETILGEAAFRHTQAEFIAAFRARRIPRSNDYDSWFMRIFFIVLAIGLFRQVEEGVTSWLFVGLALATVALGAWIADNWLYGYRRRYRKLYRDHPSAGLDFDMTFTPGRLVAHSANSDTSITWPLFARVFELRDGFLLELQPLNGMWIPKHALRPPFDAAALASFLRSQVKTYKVVDRRVRPSEEE